MEFPLLGALVAAVSISYLGVTSWTIQQTGSAPAYLALGVTCALFLLVAAAFATLSPVGTRLRFGGAVTCLCCLSFGAVGVVMALPSITLSMVAIDGKDERCDDEEGRPRQGSPLCDHYDQFHLSLLVFALLETVLGFLLCNLAWSTVWRKSVRKQFAPPQPLSQQELLETDSLDGGGGGTRRDCGDLDDGGGGTRGDCGDLAVASTSGVVHVHAAATSFA